MPIDLEERFRFDPGEDEMSPELRLEAEADLQEQAAQQSAAAAVTESTMDQPTATAAPQPTPQQPPASTEVDPEDERLAEWRQHQRLRCRCHCLITRLDSARSHSSRVKKNLYSLAVSILM